VHKDNPQYIYVGGGAQPLDYKQKADTLQDQSGVEVQSHGILTTGGTASDNDDDGKPATSQTG